MFGFFEWCCVLAFGLVMALTGVSLPVANIFMPVPWPWWGLGAFTAGCLFLSVMAFILAVLNRPRAGYTNAGCWPAVLTAISRPETRMETTPARMKYRSLSGTGSSMMLAPGWNGATSTQPEIALAMAASPPAIG